MAALEHSVVAYAVIVLIPFGFEFTASYITPIVSGAFSWTSFNIFPWNFVIFSFFFIAGCTWIMWALSYTLNKRRSEKLMVDGPYAYTRNPKGFGYLLILLGLGILMQSAVAIFVMMPAIVLAYIFYLKILEEPFMKLRHGSQYDEYRSSVSLLFPLPSRIRR
jgi:protein-S-isoprenylcysteine O-methyltransferase Ste14